MRNTAALLVGFFFLMGGALSSSAYKGEVTIAFSSEPPTMDPHITNNAIGNITWRWSYDSLISSETGTGKNLPWLAEKWEKLNHKAVKFYLRKGVKFSDGTPLTSEAFRLAMERVMKAPGQKAIFKSFDKVEILDDHTFIYRMKTPDNGLFNRLTRWAHPISPKSKGVEDAVISRNTFGTGPYILKSWSKGLRMVFEANPDWWANSRYPDRPKTVILLRIPESTTRVNALVTGEVDMIWGVMPQFVQRIKDNPQVKFVALPSVRIMFVSFFTGHGGPFDNVKVRRAVNYAIDSEKIRKTILGGDAQPIGQLLHPWNYVGYNPDKKWYGSDPEKAKTLLREAGYPNGFKAELIAPSGRYPADKATCEATAGMLKDVGIDTQCTAAPMPMYRKNFVAYRTGKKKGAAMYYMGFGNGQGDPITGLNGMVSCKGGWSGHCFEELDAAIDRAAAEPELEKQQLLFEKVTDMTKELATHKIYFQIHDTFAFKKDLRFHPRHDENLYPWEIAVK